MGPAQFSSRNVVADQRGERGKQLVFVVAGAGQFQAPLEVGGSLTCLAALRGAHQETALEPDGDFLAVSHGPCGAAGEPAECVREASQRFVYSAALPGI